jgi:hypothetical protein
VMSACSGKAGLEPHKAHCCRNLGSDWPAKQPNLKPGMSAI